MARYYEINGKLYVSVTTALTIIRKPHLEIWRGNLGNEEADRVRDEAAEFGSYIHDWCHDVVRGCTPFPDPLVDAFAQWFKATVKEVVLAEKPVWSDRYRYAGRPDLVAILKGDRSIPTVIDIKTTTDIWPEMGLQLAAYQQAMEEQGIKTKRRIIVHLSKKTEKLKTKEFSNSMDFNMFLYALSLYKYFEGGILDGRKNRDIVKIS